jgi:type I restriction enzyme S subunit
MSEPRLRFKEFGDEWQDFTLNSFGDFKNGINKSKDDFGFGYPFINLMDVFGKSSIKPSIKNEVFGLVNASDNELSSYNLLKGDVLFIRSSVKPEGVGETSAILEDLKNTVYSGFLIRFRENQNKLNLLYKKYCFSHVGFRNQLLSVSTTSANTNINQESLNQLILKIPSIPEQAKIANFLTLVDEKITQITQRGELLTCYKNGLMQQIFSQQLRFKDVDGLDFTDWKYSNIGELINEKSKKYNPDKHNEKLNCIELEHLSQETGELLGYVDGANQKSIKNKFNKGDVLFGKLRPYLKKFLKAPFDGVCSTEIWVLKGKKVTNDFLYQFIQTEQFLTLTNISSGSKMPRADWGIVSSAIVQYPSIPEQTKIANFLTALDDKISYNQTQLSALKQYKQGLLQQLFV